MPHPYLANTTSRTFEKGLNKANVRAGSASGMPNYQSLDRERRGMLGKAEKKRPLRRMEYINLYGYQPWLDYCEKNGLDPHAQKWADAHMHKLSSIGGSEGAEPSQSDTESEPSQSDTESEPSQSDTESEPSQSDTEFDWLDHIGSNSPTTRYRVG